MTYQSQETGTNTGAPVELYKFVSGAQSWYYTSSDEEISHLGQTYLPSVMKRSDHEIDGTDGESKVEITVALDSEVASLYRIIVPSRTTEVTIYRLHRSEDPPEAIIYWSGRIRAVTWSGVEAKIHCNLLGSFKRQGPNRLYQRLCPHILYSPECGLSPALYKVAGTITAVNGAVLTVDTASSQADGYWTAGYVQAGDDYRTVIAHSGNDLTLTLQMAEAGVGDTVDIFAGCDHSKTTCFNKFGDNTIHYGGTPYLPNKNPFDVGVEG